MPRLSLGSELVREGGGWEIREGERRLAAFAPEALRISLSWKALVFESDAERRCHDEHTDDIDLAEVLRRFGADLTARGVPVAWPGDPVRDPEVIRLLAEHYVTYPSARAPRPNGAAPS
jgi:hypothetical protein